VAGKLRFYTEDQQPEIYLALRQHTDDAGAVWILTRIPGRPNGRTGWVRRSALDDFHLTRYRLVIDRRHLVARLYHNGTNFWSTPIGVGAPGTPTPAGNFYIRERMSGSGGVYGPYAFGTSAYSVLSEWPRGGVIGIHGTDQPGLLPGRVSHGCIRMPNSRIRELRRLIGVGTPVTIT
jgi:lipoprotein-anchoring transpeptidase ErfK/SrfK